MPSTGLTDCSALFTLPILEVNKAKGKIFVSLFFCSGILLVLKIPFACIFFLIIPYIFIIDIIRRY